MSISPEQTCADLFSLLAIVKQSIKDLAEDEGLTQMQVAALYVIDKQPEMGMGLMAETLHCDASNVTGLVDRLVVQHLVERRESERDRRAKKLVVTSRGKEIIERIMNAMPIRLGCDKLTEHERDLLHATIRKVHA